MVCQTRSKAKRQAEQQKTRQTRSKTAKQQQTTSTAPGLICQQTRKRNKKRNVLGAAHATKERTRKQTSFNHLPTEIRLMIWEEFVRTPRIIHIDFLSRPMQAIRGYTCRFESVNWHPRESEQVCPLLGVSRESRYVALKEPFIHFGIQYPALKQTQFSSYHSIARTFSIRSRDIVFFDNAESLPAHSCWKNGNAEKIANVMIGLDVSLINYKNLDAIPCWFYVFETGYRLIEKLYNKERLQRFYCLIQDYTNATTDKAKRYSLDNIRELTPERLNKFPGRKRDLTRWLQEYDTYLSNWPRWSLYFKSEDIIPLKKLWKNVSVVG
ncbi:hypothetical protein F4679DRAFT_589428 [Xylaria curta]|nr:hypothetical protein F4679DRAFT_589428 [Xylaria curta]